MADFMIPPSKKPRLEASQLEASVLESEEVIDDMNDLYDTPPALSGSSIEVASTKVVYPVPTSSAVPTPAFQIPGLGSNNHSPQHPVNENAKDITTSSLVIKKGETSNDQPYVDSPSGIQQEQGITEGEETGTEAGIVQGRNVAPSYCSANTTDASNVLASDHPDHDMGLELENPMNEESSKGGVPKAEPKSDAPLPPQLLEPPTQQDSGMDNLPPRQKPASETGNLKTTNNERMEDPQGVNRVHEVSTVVNPPSGVQAPSTSNTAQRPDDGEQTLDAEVGLNTSLKELPEGHGVGGVPEFEIDSSPIESSSSDSSTDSSSSEGSDDDYEMLDPEEEARRLMAEDIGSDGEGEGKGVKGTGIGHVRTLNEKSDDIVEKPNVTVTADMKIEELGNVENLVDNLTLIKAKTSGEYQVLETGSVLCLEDRTVIGAITETLGRVQQPFYSVRFTNAAAITEIGISTGTKIFYVEQHSTYVFIQAIKAIKGSDASNLHDEEVGDDELEFSDDEAEAEHKRRVKVQRQSKREARTGERDGFTRGPRQGGRGNRGNRGGSAFQDRDIRDRAKDFKIHHGDPGAMNYDDNPNGVELYTPLTRPSNLHEMMGHGEAPLESSTISENDFRGSHGNRGRGDRGRGDRGRGDRGRRRGDRGRGRGGRGDGRDRGSFGRNANSDRQAQRSYSPPRTGDHPFHPAYNGYHSQSPSPSNTFIPPATTYPQQPQPHVVHPYQTDVNPYSQPLSPPTQYPHAYVQAYPQAQYPSAQSFQPQSYAQPQQPPPLHYYPSHQPTQQQYPPSQQYNHLAPSNIPPGAHINPAFFANGNGFASAGGGAGSPR